ncbi:MAG: hypothetical protein PVF58_14140 [Candidatus Methanofastidiosia archaeon]
MRDRYLEWTLGEVDNEFPGLKTVTIEDIFTKLRFIIAQFRIPVMERLANMSEEETKNYLDYMDKSTKHKIFQKLQEVMEPGEGYFIQLNTEQTPGDLWEGDTIVYRLLLLPVKDLQYIRENPHERIFEIIREWEDIGNEGVLIDRPEEKTEKTEDYGQKGIKVVD